MKRSLKGDATKAVRGVAVNPPLSPLSETLRPVTLLLPIAPTATEAAALLALAQKFAARRAERASSPELGAITVAAEDSSADPLTLVVQMTGVIRGIFLAICHADECSPAQWLRERVRDEIVIRLEVQGTDKTVVDAIVRENPLSQGGASSK